MSVREGRTSPDWSRWSLDGSREQRLTFWILWLLDLCPVLGVTRQPQEQQVESGKSCDSVHFSTIKEAQGLAKIGSRAGIVDAGSQNADDGKFANIYEI